MPITSVAPAAMRTEPTPKATTTSGLGPDAFLKLLVAQMKYQDPTAPSDPSALMQQSSQLAMVERLEQLSDATSQLLAAEHVRSATGLIGREVTWSDTAGGDHHGVVTSVRVGAAGPSLVVGDDELPYDAVTSVAPAPLQND